MIRVCFNSLTLFDTLLLLGWKEGIHSLRVRSGAPPTDTCTTFSRETHASVHLLNMYAPVATWYRQPRKDELIKKVSLVSATMLNSFKAKASAFRKTTPTPITGFDSTTTKVTAHLSPILSEVALCFLALSVKTRVQKSTGTKCRWHHSVPLMPVQECLDTHATHHLSHHLSRQM